MASKAIYNPDCQNCEALAYSDKCMFCQSSDAFEGFLEILNKKLMTAEKKKKIATLLDLQTELFDEAINAIDDKRHEDLAKISELVQESDRLIETLKKE